MIRLIYIVLLLALVGCEAGLVDMAPTQPSPNPDRPVDKPITPIKRRPIVPNDKTNRPRFSDKISLPISMFTFGGKEQLSVTLCSVETGEEQSVIVTPDMESLTMPLMEGTCSYYLIVEGDDTYYVELLEIVE